MNEVGLRKIAKALSIKIVGKHAHWLHSSCPLAPWTHERGTDRNPSFNLLVNEQGESYYKCFACKGKGRISSLVRLLEDYRETTYDGLALEADSMDYAITLPDYDDLNKAGEDIILEPLNEAVYGDIYTTVFDVPEAIAYLESRGINADAAEHLDLRFDPEEQRIIFPVRDDNGDLFGFTGRSILSPENYPYKRYPKVRDYAGLPKEFLLLGAEHIDDTKPNLVVEGLFGYAHLFVIGADEICNPLAMLGSEMTSYKADLLLDLGRPTYLLPDNDEAGDVCLFGEYDANTSKYAGGGAIDKLKGSIPLFIPEWPTAKSDPDQLSLEEVKYMLSHAPLA